MTHGADTEWDETMPLNSEGIKYGAQEIRLLRAAVGLRIDKEHDALAGSSAGGEHKQGSGKIYYDVAGSAPTQRPDEATNFTTADSGRLFYETDTGKLKVYVFGTGWVDVKANDYVALSVLSGDIQASPVIITPTIASFVNSGHNHTTAAKGGRAYPLYMLYEHRETNGVDGGTATTGSWLLFDDWTEVQDEGSDGVLAESNKAITLQIGTYVIRAWHVFFGCDAARLRLYNSSDSDVELEGGNAFSTTSASAVAHLEGKFTLAAAQSVRLEYQVGSTQATNGLGVKAEFGQELYGAIALWKVAD